MRQLMNDCRLTISLRKGEVVGSGLADLLEKKGVALADPEPRTTRPTLRKTGVQNG